MNRETMRRRVHAAGGYYSREQWVLPGASHNCAPYSVDTVWCATLEEAYEQCEEHARAVAAVHSYGEAEAAYLRGAS